MIAQHKLLNCVLVQAHTSNWDVHNEFLNLISMKCSKVLQTTNGQLIQPELVKAVNEEPAKERVVTFQLNSVLINEYSEFIPEISCCMSKFSID